MSLKAWEDKDTEKLIELYVNKKEHDVYKLAEIFGKKHRSVISKLVQLRIYIKPIDPTERPPTVKMMVIELENMLNIHINGSNLNNKQNLELLLKELRIHFSSK